MEYRCLCKTGNCTLPPIHQAQFIQNASPESDELRLEELLEANLEVPLDEMQRFTVVECKSIPGGHSIDELKDRRLANTLESIILEY